MNRAASLWRIAAVALMTAVWIALPAGQRDANTAPALSNQDRAARAVMPQNKVPGAVESTARRLANGFRQQGYEVARGYFELYTMDDCDRSYEVMGSCYGNNPAAPYVFAVVPAWPDEWVDAATGGAFGDTANGYSGSYRLDPREAMVILGVLPPPADYFGLQTYLFTRPGEWKQDSIQYTWLSANSPSMLELFFSEVPANPDRLQLFANLSNSINNVVIANQSGGVWDELRYFVITANRNMDSALREAFARVGIADRDVFTEAIPEDMHIGLDAGADDFFTLIRYAMPHDGGGAGTRSDSWRQRLPLVVLRIRNPLASVDSYPPVAFEPRTATAPPEAALAPDLITLAKAVCQRWGQPCDVSGQAFEQRAPRFLNLQLPPILLTGPECAKVGMNCLAPTEDTTYYISGKLPLDDTRVYAVVGALSTVTANGTYVGLGLNSSLKKLAFENITSDDLEGSADDYAQVANHEKFFVQYFARECSGLESLTGENRCFSIGDLLPRCTDRSDPLCDMLVLSLRAYIRPGTERGTDPTLALNPRFIPLSK